MRPRRRRYAAAASRTRFQAMDINGDGVITPPGMARQRSLVPQSRLERRRPAGRRRGSRRRAAAEPLGRPRHRRLDRLRGRLDRRRASGRSTTITTAACRAPSGTPSSELFTRVDRNRDNFVSAAEFTGEDDDDREDRFADLDNNRDGRLTRNEWHGSAAVFNALDANRDGVLTRAEAIGTER